MRSLVVVAVAAMAACAERSTAGPGRAVLRVSGSTTVNPVAADAAEALRAEGLRITVDTQGGSAGGIAQLVAGQIDVAMSSKPLTEAEKGAGRSGLVATAIGQDAVGVIVRREVYDGGVRSLTREQLKVIFEGRARNWSELGGPNLAVFVYDKEPGRGTREVLDRYLYNDGKAPPPSGSPNVAIVGGNEEGRAKALSTPGSVTPLSVAFVAGQPQLAAVAVDGVEPRPEHIRDGRYPLARPLFLITDGPPRGAARRLVDYVLSDAGQALVRKHGYLTLADLAGG